MISLDLFAFPKEIEEKLKDFAKSDKFVNSLILSLDSPQVRIQILHQKQDDLLSIISKIKKLVGNKMKSFDLMFLQQEKEINTLPILD